MNPILEITISEIPSYYIIGRKKRYTSMNLFYSNTHWSVRKGIVDKAKLSLKPFVDKKLFNIKSQAVHIEYIYESNKTSFDVENRLGFWSKVFLDYVKGTKLIPDDNVKSVKSVKYSSVYHTVKSDNLKIIVYALSSKSVSDESEESSVSVRSSSRGKRTKKQDS
jgi:hypothetical protein